MAAPEHLVEPIAAIALLDEPTRRRIHGFVAAAGAPVGRDDVAAELGISRELAAFHLDRLVAGNLLTTEYRRRSGRSGPGAGRPAKLYRPAGVEIAVSVPPRAYARAAETLAAGVERLPEAAAAVADAARTRGTRAGQEARRSAGTGASRRARRASLVSLLEEAGYAPRAMGTDGPLTLGNCPYDALAREHRRLTCAMNLAWAEGVVSGLRSDLRAELRPEAGSCCVVFRPAGAATSD